MAVITADQAFVWGIKPSALKAAADWNDAAARNRGRTTDADRQRHRHQAAKLLMAWSKMRND